MARYLSVPILALAAALSASILPPMMSFALGLFGELSPAAQSARGQAQLVMLLVLAWSLRADLETAFVWALVGGIVSDMLSVLPLGASSAALVIIVFAGNRAARQLYRIRPLSLLALAFAASLFYIAFNYLALLLLGYRYDPLPFLRLVALPTLLYNLVAILPVYGLARLLQRRMGSGTPAAARILAHDDSGRGPR